jgi:hypothetical protein
LRDANGNIQIGTDVYTCHRFPPSAVLAPTGPGAHTLFAFFPPVTSEMVCSLHEFPDVDGAVLAADVPGMLGN